MTTKLNIYQKINQVMKSVEYVKKDLKVQGYAAVSHDSVTASLRKYMVEVGIVLTVNQTSQQFDERENGAKMRLYHGSYDVRFTNIDDKEDFIVCQVCSQSYDNGDKAPGKAMSYATKYALLKTFMIETGENEESRAHDFGNDLISGAELEELDGLITQAGKTKESVIEYLNKQGLEIKQLSELNIVSFQKTKSLLVNAINKAAA